MIPRLLQELERVRIENASLLRRLEEIEGADIAFDPNVLGPDDAISFEVQIDVPSKDGSTEFHSVQGIDVAIGVLFIRIYDDLLSEPRSYSVGQYIGVALLPLLHDVPKDGSCGVSSEQVEKLRFQLEALNLIEVFGGNTSSTFGSLRPFVAWRPTDKGRRFVVQNRSVMRRAASA